MASTTEYDAFGQITGQTNPAAGVRFAFTGREYDPETGLYYYRARYYDSNLGRFISEDPLRFDAGDANLFRYVGNSPTNGTDPSGKLVLTETGLFYAIHPGMEGAFAVGYLQGATFTNIAFIARFLESLSALDAITDAENDSMDLPDAYDKAVKSVREIAPRKNILLAYRLASAFVGRDSVEVLYRLGVNGLGQAGLDIPGMFFRGFTIGSREAVERLDRLFE